MKLSCGGDYTSEAKIKPEMKKKPIMESTETLRMRVTGESRKSLVSYGIDSRQFLQSRQPLKILPMQICSQMFSSINEASTEILHKEINLAEIQNSKCRNFSKPLEFESPSR